MKVEIKFKDKVKPVVIEDAFLWDFTAVGGFFMLKRPGFDQYFSLANIDEFKIIEKEQP